MSINGIVCYSPDECSCPDCEITSLKAEVTRLQDLVDNAWEFIFSEEHADDVYGVRRNGIGNGGFWRWELSVSHCSGGGLLETYEGEDAMNLAVAEAKKRARL